MAGDQAAASRSGAGVGPTSVTVEAWDHPSGGQVGAWDSVWAAAAVP